MTSSQHIEHRLTGLLLPRWPHARYSIDQRLQRPLAVGLALLGGGLIGALAAAHLLLAVAVLLAVPVALLILVDVRSGLWCVLGIAALLPFAVFPVKVGFTPTLFEITASAVLVVWVVHSALQRNRRWPVHRAGLFVVTYLIVTLFAFVLGLNRGYTQQTYHDYAKFLLASLLFFPVWTHLVSRDDVRRLLLVWFGAYGAAAFLGLALYAGGPSVTQAILARLIPFGYPSERIVRYIEDDPAKPMRLISTSVDPNAFGGALAVVLVLAIVQCVAKHPLLPRWVCLGVILLTAPAVLLTYSRAAWVGVVIGVGIVALVRYRWIILPGTLGLVVVAALGIGSGFLQRLLLGLRLQDPATQMRLVEYRTALEVIRRYPLFGVGFGAAPTVELWTGVSSIYLTVAERMGLFGLGMFLIVVASIGTLGWRAWRQVQSTPDGDLLLALLAAQVTVLIIGFFDHYFVNITFPHMVWLFWLLHALILGQSLRVLTDPS